MIRIVTKEANNMHFIISPPQKEDSGSLAYPLNDKWTGPEDYDDQHKGGHM